MDFGLAGWLGTRHSAWWSNDLFAIVSGLVDTDDGTHDDF